MRFFSHSSASFFLAACLAVRCFTRFTRSSFFASFIFVYSPGVKEVKEVKEVKVKEVKGRRGGLHWSRGGEGWRR